MSGAGAAADFRWPVRVYYEDTDAAGVVYYANYLKFMERARTECLRALGFEQRILAQSHGVAFVVRHADIDFIKPALLDDELSVSVRVAELGASVIVFLQEIARGADILAAAKVKIACVKIASLQPVRIPAEIRRRL